MHHHAVQIRIDLFHAYLMRHAAKVQGDVSQASAVIGDKSFAAFGKYGFLHKFTIRK